MWLATTIGFYSAVEHRDLNGILVRARARVDLERLLDIGTTADAGAIEHTPAADYPFRVLMPRAAWAATVAELAHLIDYDNFKGAVGNTNPARASLYHRVWAVLRGIEAEQPWTAMRGQQARQPVLPLTRFEDPFGLPARMNAGLASPAIDLDEDCPDCGGTRWVEGGRACDLCNSDGDNYPF